MKQAVVQRYTIKYCVKLNKLATERLPILQETYRKNSLAKSQMFTKMFTLCLLKCLLKWLLSQMFTTQMLLFSNGTKLSKTKERTLMTNNAPDVHQVL